MKIVIEVCHMNRWFGLPPIVTSKTFFDKEKADKYAKKFDDHPNKFVWARYENGKEVEL